MRILVTGATGFIGARLLSRLSVECDCLRVFRRVKSDIAPIKNIKFEDFIGDVTNKEDVMRAVEGCDVVFHVAANVSYWDKLKKHQYDVNVTGTKNIALACLAHKVKRLVYTSSVVAIGFEPDGALASEETGYERLAPYKISYCDTKHLAECEVQKGVAQGLDAVIVNPGAVFGPADLRRYRGHLYGSRVWYRRFYVGGGIATVDVDDVVDGHVRAWKKGRTGERYILANENLTFKDISSVIADVMGGAKPRWRIGAVFVFAIAYLATLFSKVTGTMPLATIPMAKFTRIKLFYSNEKARHELGMTFHPFRESIERAVAWLGENNYKL